MSKLSFNYLDLIKEFEATGDFLSCDEHADWIGCYEKDLQELKKFRPYLVYRPHFFDYLPAFIRACSAKAIPIKIRGAGTGWNFSSLANNEGILILVNHFKKILNYDAIHGKVILEPGVTISQLNHFVEKDGWEFPLEMATNGVSGIGGCLSCHSIGYQQNSNLLYSALTKLTLIDGMGEMMDVPWNLVCGAEGLFGVITQIEMQLTRKINRMYFVSNMTFQQAWGNLSLFKNYQCIKSAYWMDAQIFLKLEGESYFLEPSIESLKRFITVEQVEGARKIELLKKHSDGKAIFFSSALPFHVLIQGKNFIENLAENMQFQTLIGVELISGNLQIYLFSQVARNEFQNNLEKLLRKWVNFLKEKGGLPIASYGLGKLWNGYMNPFCDLKDLAFIKNLQKSFDPHQIFNSALFFPKEGQSLVQVKECQI